MPEKELQKTIEVFANSKRTSEHLYFIYTANFTDSSDSKSIRQGTSSALLYETSVRRFP